MKTVKTIEKAGRQVWLAGLGVALLGREYAGKKLDEIFESGNSLISDMLSKGVDVEADIKAMLNGKVVTDDRISELREKLGLNRESREDTIEKLTAKVDALSQVVAKLAEQKAKEEKAEAAAAKKVAAPASKAAEAKATTTAAKPAAKRTTTRKPRATAATTARKTTARKPAAAKTTAAKKDSDAAE